MKQKLGKIYTGSPTGLMLLLFASLFSAVSVCVFVFVRAQESITQYQNAGEGALLRDALNGTPVLLIVLLTAAAYLLLSRCVSRISIPGLIVGLALGFNMLVSLSMEHTELHEIFLPGGLKINLLVLFGFTCMCTMGTETVFHFCDKAANAVNQRDEATSRGNRRHFLIAFLLIVLCWIPGLYYCWPGSAMADTLNQIRSVAGPEGITAAPPILSTLVFGYLYQFGLAVGNEGLGLFLSVIAQVLLNGLAMAFVAEECFRYTRSRKLYIVCILFFGINPVWQNAMQLIVTDVLHTGCFLLFFIHYLRCIQEPKKSLSNVILLGILVLAISFTRRAACFIGIISLVIVAFVHWKKYFLPYVFCLISVVGIFTFCNQVVYPALDIQPEWESEICSMQFQQTALYCRTYQNEMSDKEKQIINRTLDFDTIVREYNPMISDAVKLTYHGTGEDHREFWDLYRKMFLRHPGIFLKAIVMDSFEHMNPWFDSPQLRVYIPDIDDKLQVGYAHENAYDICDYWNGWLKVPAARLFIGTGLYMWLCAVAFGYTAKKRSLLSLLGQVPVVILFLGLFMSHVNGEIRCGYPLTAVTPLVYGWMLYAVARKEKLQAEKNRIRAEKDALAAAKRKQAQSLSGDILIVDSEEPTEDDLPQELPEGFDPEKVTPDLPPAEKTRFKRAYKPGTVLSFITRYIPVPASPKTYLDVLKVLAIYLVLWNHTSNGFALFNRVLDMPQHLLYLCVSLFDKIAVPLFFMASGALLLGREESWRTILTRRVKRFVMILLVVSIINYVYYYNQDKNFSIYDFLVRLYTGNVMTPLWYLYTYLALLLTLPFLRKLARCMREQDYLWLLGLYLLTQLISVADYFWFHGSQTHSWDFVLFTSQNYVLFTLFGFYIDRTMKPERINLENFAILVMLSVLAIGAGYMLTEWKMAYVGQWSEAESQTFMNTFVAIPSITVFYAAKAWFRRHPVSGTTAAVWSLLSTGTFGTYLFERYWRDTAWFAYEFASRKLGPFTSSFVHVFVACALGILATLAYKLVTSMLKSFFTNPKILRRKNKKTPFVYKVPKEDISDLEEIETLLVGNAQRSTDPQVRKDS